MSNNESASAVVNTITPDELKPIVRIAIECQFPLMIWGPPGVGKSEIVREVNDELGYTWYDIRATMMDPVDIHGIPRLDKDDQGNHVTRWSTPSILPPQGSPGKFTCLIDEITSCASSMQAVFYQLIQLRRIGDYVLPEGAAVLAAGNRTDDLSVAHRMPAALASRFRQVTVRADAPKWVYWAFDKGLSYEVPAFIQFRPDLLHKFDPETYRKGDTAFPTPRTWEMVANALSSTVNGRPVRDDATSLRALVIGSVGMGAGLEFLSFLSMIADLPAVSTVFATPGTAPVPPSPDAQIAMVSALMKSANQENIGDALVYIRRLRRELQQFAITAAQSSNPAVQYTSEFNRWSAEIVGLNV